MLVVLKKSPAYLPTESHLLSPMHLSIRSDVWIGVKKSVYLLQELHRPFQRHDKFVHLLRCGLELSVLGIVGVLQDILRYLI